MNVWEMKNSDTHEFIDGRQQSGFPQMEKYSCSLLENFETSQVTGQVNL